MIPIWNHGTPGAFSKNVKRLIFGALRFRFFGQAMNRELKQRMGIEKLVWKSPTSDFDMPSSRCYEAKCQQKVDAGHPLRKNIRGPPVRRFLVWSVCCLFEIKRICLPRQKLRFLIAREGVCVLHRCWC